MGSIGAFIYCEVEEEFGCEESDDHPNNLGEEATGGSAAFGGYAKVNSAPHRYDQRADAECDDPKRAPQLRFFHPQIRGIAGSSGISGWILHLLCASVYTIDPAKVM